MTTIYATYQLSKLKAFWFQTRGRFSKFPYISLCKTGDPGEADLILTPGAQCENLHRGPLVNATHQISKLEAFLFQIRRFSKKSPITIYLCQTGDPLGGANFDPGDII